VLLGENVAKRKKTGIPTDDSAEITRIKRLVVIAMFSDDELMNRLVLKGGNAMDLLHGGNNRSSVDIDFSMEGAFSPSEVSSLPLRIERCLQETFELEGFRVFDVTFAERPEELTPNLQSFWGGYDASFKIIALDKYKTFHGNLEELRRNAFVIGGKGRLEMDISKFEYCEGKLDRELDGHRVFVYSPIMIVCEKLRAICQQMNEYKLIVHRKRSGAARARDFVDIHHLVKKFKLDLSTDENRKLLQLMFTAKKVPVEWLTLIPNYREFHRQNFLQVKNTVKPDVQLKSFDFYFDFTLKLCGKLKAAWDK